MKNINFFRITIIAALLFTIVMLGYEVFAIYMFKTYKSTQALELYLIENYKMILVLEPYLKQGLLTLTILLFGLAIANNILKLTKIDKTKKWNLYMMTTALLIAIIILMLIMMTHASVLLYEITSLLLMLLIIIWISIVIFEYIKTKNNKTSIFTRVVIAVLALTTIVTNTYSVINDYKVNDSLNNSFDYRIEVRKEIIENLTDEETIAIFKQEIEGYEAMKLTLYTTSLFSGKSSFAMYDKLYIDFLLNNEEKLIAIEDRTSMLENYLYTEDFYSTYTINYGLYLGGYSSAIIAISLIVLSVITLAIFPLKRIEEVDNSALLNLVETKLDDGVLTVIEYETIMNKINKGR